MPSTGRAKRSSFFLLSILLILTVLFVPPQDRGYIHAQPAAGVSLEMIAPATVVADRPPPGWTHLIIKSQPRLPETEKRRIHPNTAKLATFVFTAIVARVETDMQNGVPQYRLSRIGSGVGARVGRVDMIISPETEQRLGANLDFEGRLVLGEVYKHLQEIRLVAASGVCAIVDTPVAMPQGPVHRKAIIRYALLLDPRTARMDTLCWRVNMDDQGRRDVPPGTIEWLPPNKLFDSVLEVDPREFTLGIPSERAFAVVHIPEGGRRFAMPEGLRGIAGLERMSPPQAGQLIETLRQMIRQPASPMPPMPPR